MENDGTQSSFSRNSTPIAAALWAMLSGDADRPLNDMVMIGQSP
jgi:hypothetical protein